MPQRHVAESPLVPQLMTMEALVHTSPQNRAFPDMVFNRATCTEKKANMPESSEFAHVLFNLHLFSYLFIYFIKHVENVQHSKLFFTFFLFCMFLISAFFYIG